MAIVNTHAYTCGGGRYVYLVLGSKYNVFVRKISEEEIKERLERAVFYYGRVPSSRELSRFLHRTTLIRRYGSYNAALEYLDYPPYATRPERNYHSMHSRHKKWLRDEIKAYYGHYCRNCRATHKLHVNHNVPWRWSRSNALDNVEVLCVACHAQKEARRRRIVESWFYRKYVERWPKKVDFPDV